MFTTSNVLVFIAICVYLLGMILIGVRFTKRQKDTSDYYLGGRQLGPFVTAMSAEASDMSGWLLMGLPGVALMTGVPEAIWTAIGLAVGTYLNWLIVAKRIRVYSEKVDAFTLPDFFSKRFGDTKHVLTLISAVIIVIFFIPYTASGFSACGKLFSSMFGVEYTTAMIVSACVIALYCTLGGFLAASTTDFIQSIVMTFALIVVLGLGEGLSNGFGNLFNTIKSSSMDGYLNVFKGFDVAGGETMSYGFLPVVSTLAWGLGYFGMPHILLRFMAIKDRNKLKLSRRVASIWVVISMGVAVLIGIVGWNLMSMKVVPAYESSSAAESIVVDIAKWLSTHGYIPAFAGGVILAGILASTMSTADSQLLAAASGISQNLLGEVFGVKMSKKKGLWVARICVIVISGVAVCFALNPDSSVFKIVSFAWAGFGAAFGPVVIFGLFWKRMNKWGALAGMVFGGGMIFIWKFIVRPLGGMWDIYELLPAFIVACVAILVVSLVTKAPDAEIVNTFNDVKSSLKAE